MITLVRVAPISVGTKLAFVDYADGRGSLEEVPDETFPPSPDGASMRAARIGAGVTLGELARSLGIGVATVSDLEHGRQTTDAEGWREIRKAIAHIWALDVPITTSSGGWREHND